MYQNNKKTKKYHFVRTVTKSNRKIVEKETKWIPLKHTDFPGTDTSINSVKVVLYSLSWYRHFNK
jgi:hypothetical protein